MAIPPGARACQLLRRRVAAAHRYGHSLGLKVGSYLNNCICMDKDPDPKYEQDVAWFTAAGFDEVVQLAVPPRAIAPDPPPCMAHAIDGPCR